MSIRYVSGDVRTSSRFVPWALFLGYLTGVQLLLLGRWLGLEGADPSTWLGASSAMLLLAVGVPSAVALALIGFRVCARHVALSRILLTEWSGAMVGGLLLLRGGPWLTYAGALVGCVTAASLAGMYAAPGSRAAQTQRFPA